MKMLPVKIIASLSLVVFGAINCKPNSGSVDEKSALNALESQESAAGSDQGASFALADQGAEATEATEATDATDAAPCPNPGAKAPIETY